LVLFTGETKNITDNATESWLYITDFRPSIRYAVLTRNLLKQV